QGTGPQTLNRCVGLAQAVERRLDRKHIRIGEVGSRSPLWAEVTRRLGNRCRRADGHARRGLCAQPLRSEHRSAHRDTRAAKHLAARYRKDRKSTRLNSSHRTISYAVFCLKKKKKI